MWWRYVENYYDRGFTMLKLGFALAVPGIYIHYVAVKPVFKVVCASRIKACRLRALSNFTVLNMVTKKVGKKRNKIEKFVNIV